MAEPQKRTALAIRHVAFEDLGILAPLLAERGFSVEYLEMGSGVSLSKALESELLVVLGGPIGVYEEAAYPFLRDEVRLLERRLAANQPTLGICLGAQLIARALGARVYPGGKKEIGWSELSFTDQGRESALLPLSLAGAKVLHWHGDTFELPSGSSLLASSALYENQAFAHGPGALALQFHLEASATGLERWYIGHAAELASARISVPELRSEGEKYCAPLESAARACFERFVDQAFGSSPPLQS